MVIDITAVETQHFEHLVEQTFSCCFNSKHIKGFHDAVAIRSFRIDEIQGQHLHQIGTQGIQGLNIFSLKISKFLVVNHIIFNL